MDASDEFGSYLRGERKALSQALMDALWKAMPWGLAVDLGAGRSATLTKLGPPKMRPVYAPGSGVAEGEREVIGEDPAGFICDFRLTNADNDHVEISVAVSGGGGAYI